MKTRPYRSMGPKTNRGLGSHPFGFRKSWIQFFFVLLMLPPTVNKDDNEKWSNYIYKDSRYEKILVIFKCHSYTLPEHEKFSGMLLTLLNDPKVFFLNFNSPQRLCHGYVKVGWRFGTEIDHPNGFCSKSLIFLHAIFTHFWKLEKIRHKKNEMFFFLTGSFCAEVV